MAEIAFDTDTLRYIQLFEERTGARVKDCLEAEDKLVFLVYPGEIHKAVGPGGLSSSASKGSSRRRSRSSSSPTMPRSS